VLPFFRSKWATSAFPFDVVPLPSLLFYSNHLSLIQFEVLSTGPTLAPKSFRPSLSRMPSYIFFPQIDRPLLPVAHDPLERAQLKVCFSSAFDPPPRSFFASLSYSTPANIHPRPAVGHAGCRNFPSTVSFPPLSPSPIGKISELLFPGQTRTSLLWAMMVSSKS